MNYFFILFAALIVGIILYALIYAEDHWLDEPEELQNDADNDSTS